MLLPLLANLGLGGGPPAVDNVFGELRLLARFMVTDIEPDTRFTITTNEGARFIATDSPQADF